MIGFELLLCYLLLFLAARADCLFRALALDPATVKPKSPFGIDIPMDSPSLSGPLYRADYGGDVTIGNLLKMGGITNFMNQHFRIISFEATIARAGLFWTHAMILAFALIIIEAIDLTLMLFLSAVDKKLVVELFLSNGALVRTIGIWFRKRRRKPPDKVLSTNIGPNPTHPSSLNSPFDYGKRGRRGEYNGGTTAAAEAQDAAPAYYFFRNISSQLISNVNQCFPVANQIFDFVVLSLHIGSEFLMAINNKRPAVMTIKSFTFPMAVVQNIIYQAIYCAAAIHDAVRMIQSTEAILDWSLLSTRNYCQRGSQKLFHLCPGSAAMISAVLPNTTFWLPRESTSNITSEGGTQILAKLYQSGQLTLAITPIRWCGLCLRFNKQLCESVSFRGRAQGINFWQRYLVCFQSPYLVPCGSRTSI